MTRVLLGSTAHDSPANGLVLKSDKTLELRTTARELAPSPDGSKIIVFLSREVTKELGPAVILLEGPGSTRIPAEIEIIANP